MLCEQCNRRMKGAECFQLHQSRNSNGEETGKSVCQSFYRCPKCSCSVTEGKKITLCEDENGINIRRSVFTHTDCGKSKCYLTPIKLKKEKRKRIR